MTTPAALFALPELVARLDEADGPADAIRQVSSLLIAIGAADATLVEAATAKRIIASAASHPYVLVTGPLPGVRTPAGALAVFRLPIQAPDTSGTSLPVRIFAVLGTLDEDVHAGQAVRAVLEDTELVDILTDLPAEEMHPLLCDAVDFYASHSPRGAAPRAARVESTTGRRVRDIWRLLEAGDNYLKNSSGRDRPRAEARARARWSQALSEATDLGNLRLQTLAQRRLGAPSGHESDTCRGERHG